MNVDDRLRQSLHRSVEAVAASAELLGRIERGLRPARGRRPLVIAAGAAAALGVFAVAFLLLVHQFGAESARQPSPSPPQFRTSIVQWSGDRFAGFWKVYYRITNQGTAPAGAAVACFLRDASGDTSEPGEGTVRYVAPHRVVEGLVVVKGFKFEPAGGQCTAQPLPPVSPPPPPPPVAPHFVPTDIAFWDTEHGVAVGAIRSRPCRDRCTGAIAITADGGERWTVTFRGSQYDWVTVLGTTDAWVSRKCSADDCLIHTTDGGREWSPVPHDRGISNPFFLTSSSGWAIDGESQRSLLATDDGGRTWSTASHPCADPGFQVMAAWFMTADHGWATCAGEPYSTFLWPKAVVETTDGGGSWHLVAGAILPEDKRRHDLGHVGLIRRIQFVDERHGWLWVEYSLPETTDDGGHTWHLITNLPHTDTESFTGWSLSDRTGFALEYYGGVTTLRRTDDGGGTWHVIRRWRDTS